MEAEQSRGLRQDAPPMTFDEASMERSKNFVKALRELKNIRSQLYSAAEYCEKSYLNSEEKQMVLDNLKDYAVRALVNAVDHLGTVASNLTDLLEQQTLDVSAMELKVTCLNQQLLTCRTYMDMEGIRQQQLLAIVPRHHEHYLLPKLVNKRVHFTPDVQTDPREIHGQARPRVHHPGSSSAKKLSWHLASETKPTLIKETNQSSSGSEVQRTPSEASGKFDLLGNDPKIRKKPSTAHPERSSRTTVSGIAPQTLALMHKNISSDYRPLPPFRSCENPAQHGIVVHTPARNKGVLSSLFVKEKEVKLKTSAVA